MYKQTDVRKKPVDVVLDPNTLSKNNSISVSLIKIALNGEMIAYGTSENGSEWLTIKIRNVETLKDNPGEELRFVRYSEVSWMSNNKGFFYSVCITCSLLC